MEHPFLMLQVCCRYVAGMLQKHTQFSHDQIIFRGIVLSSAMTVI